MTARIIKSFAELNEEEKFGTIYADPPWQYSNKATRSAASSNYPTLSVDEIAAINVPAIVADNAHLHLWATSSFLFDAKKIIEAWEFDYKSSFVWCKPQMGLGNYWRISHEFLLLGVRGRCRFADLSQLSWICCDRGTHSSKPEVVRRIIERVSPAPRLELFGRHPADGWTVWGDDIVLGMYDKDVVFQEDQSN